MKLAVLTSHPIQYQVPLFRKLADKVDLTVYFCSTLGIDGTKDPGFGISVAWDRPLLEGYRHRFLKNYSFYHNPQRFGSFVNPSIFKELLGDYDAVWIHGYSIATYWMAYLAAWSRNLPILLHGETILHDGGSSFKKRWKKILLTQLFKRVRAFLAIGTRSRKFYEAFGAPSEKIFLSPYSVDNDFFMSQKESWKPKKRSIKEQIGITDDAPVLLMVSKLYPGKRPQDALLAFERLKTRAHLVFVGDGESRPELQRYVSDRKIQRVYFLGFKNQTELPLFYALADLLLLPSASERWGLVVNEAMCFGLPVITTEAAACSDDLIVEGENGFIHKVGDVEALNACLEKTLASPDRLAQMGEKSLAIISKWNYDRCVAGTLEALSFAVGNKRSPLN